jgi:hypothetical protein
MVCTFHHKRPPILDAHSDPFPWVDAMVAKPILEKLSNSSGEATMDEEVIIGFLGLLAKGAKAVIIPTAFAQPIRRGKPILES